MTNKEQIELENNYGQCPKCGGGGVMRERSFDGNTTCVNGHITPSRDWNTRHVKETPKTEHVSKTCTKNGENLTRDELLEALKECTDKLSHLYCHTASIDTNGELEEDINRFYEAIANAEQGGV